MSKASRFFAICCALLAACGQGTPDRAARPAPRADIFAPGFTGPMSTAHAFPSAVVLNDGTVLVATAEGAETWDPATNQWTPTGAFSNRQFHAMVKLPDGRVLAAGGENGSSAAVDDSAQIYDPSARTWSAAAAPLTPRSRAAATTLADGRVLVVGGFNAAGVTLSSAEIYDAVTGVWTAIAPATHPYVMGIATLLNDGRVLLSGPYGADLFNPATGTFTSVPATARSEHVATLLPGGKVLLTAGTATNSEIFDPVTGSVTPAAPMLNTARQGAFGALLSNGAVLVAGGFLQSGASTPTASIESYDAAANTWSTAGTLAHRRFLAVMIPVSSGQGLVAGGRDYQLSTSFIDLSAAQSAELVGAGSACAPTTCSAQAASCGLISDGCAGTLSCGACAAGLACVANSCVAACVPATCAALGANCGTVSDGCGGTLSCGICGAGQVCGSSNLCVAGPNQAAYDPAYAVPRCAGPHPVCDSGTLLNGRAGLGPETNAPDTLHSACADGTSGTYHTDESLDRLTIQSVDGTPLAAGKPAQITATVWAYSGFSSDFLDLYSSPSADAPVWTLISTQNPIGPGAQTLTANFTPGATPTQVIRGVFRFSGTADPCAAGSFNDHDDLMFDVSVPQDVTPPSVSITFPADGSTVALPWSIGVVGTDDRAVTKLELYEGALLIGTINGASGSFSFTTNAGSHTYTAKAYDAAGNTGTSAPVTLIGVVNLPPVISITSPAEGQTISGSVVMTVNATDDGGVSSVQYFDGATLAFTATAPPYSWPFSSWAMANGAHTFTARAFDGAGLSASASVHVVVNNDHTPPAVAVTAPAAGSSLTGVVALTATATDDVGVTRVEFSYNGILIGQAGPAFNVPSSWVLSWNTTSIAPGTAVTLTARAYDAAFNSTVSAGVAVTIKDAIPPTVKLASPLSGSTLTGVNTITVNAADNVAVTKVELYDTNTLMGVATLVSAGTYSFSWNTNLYSNGSHSIFARAYDAAANATSSNIATVTLNNDKVLPVTTLMSPSTGSTLQGTISLSATATDNVAVQTVRFLLDGTTVIATGTPVTGSTSWIASWNSAAFSGTHTMSSQAVDTSGNVGSSTNVITIKLINADSTPPAVTITSPTSGSTVAGPISVLVSATDNIAVAKVELYDGSTLIGSTSTTGPLYKFVWDPTTATPGVHTLTSRAYDTSLNVGVSPAVAVTVGGTSLPPAANAVYDAVRKAPACATLGAGCDSGTLLNGRAGLGPEANAAANTIVSCPDGTSGTYHSDESLDRLKVSTLDGGPLLPGKTVRIDATVWAFGGFSSDHLDLYYAASALSPSWVLIGTLTPTAGGASTLSATYVLPAGGLQAIRGVFRYMGTAAPCTTGAFDDHDDLVFATQ